MLVLLLYLTLYYSTLICASDTQDMQLSITAPRQEAAAISLQLNLDMNIDESLEEDFIPTEAENDDNANRCPEGFIRHKNSCYHIVDDSSEPTWAIANTYCLLHQSHLVNIDSESEQLFIESLINNIKGTSAFWLGATNRKGRGLWEWFSTGKSLVYSLWVSHWSSWAYEIEPGSCALLDTNESFQWMFWPCVNNFYMAGKKHDQKTGIGFICEHESPRTTRKIRHRKQRRRRRQRRKNRRNRGKYYRHRQIIGQTALNAQL